VEERVIRFRTRTILALIGIVIAVAVLIQIVSVARQVLTWIIISLFFALALNPLVELFQRTIIRRRLASVGLTYLLVFIAIGALAATLIPTLVNEVNEFIEALPGYVEDLTEGRGRLGEFADRYDLVERVREAVESGGAAQVLGVSGTALAITKSLLTLIVAIVTIAFMTFFMLLEGPAWVERGLLLVPETSRERWRNIGRGIYRTVGGYVSGNLVISLIAGVVTTVLLSVLSIQYAIALGLVVAILDLIPLAGATLAAIIVTTVAFLDDVKKGVIVLVFFVVYQQIENHILYPLVYSRTVQLSPLAVLIAVLIGAELAGVLGALGAIPVAGTIQVILVDFLRHRRERAAQPVLQ
jgi:predicted PurR-regulated permease PerM